MLMSAESGYAQTKRETATPRVIEVQLFLKIAAEIEAADPSTFEGTARLAEALHRNTRFWTALSTDISQPGNALDEALKANILRLAAFSFAHGLKVLNEGADRMALVQINRTVAAGLRQVPAADADAA